MSITPESRDGIRAAMLHGALQDAIEAIGNEAYSDERAARAVMSAVALYSLLDGDMPTMMLLTMRGMADNARTAGPERAMWLQRRAEYVQGQLRFLYGVVGEQDG